MSRYKLQNIGKVFNDKALRALEGTLNNAGESGYHFHSVIEVTQPGCMGFGAPTITYVAVFERDEHPPA